MNFPANDNLLELDALGYRYPDGSVGLASCSLAIPRGSRNALIGANGSGKTTLFQHANGLLRPLSGELRYGGRAMDYSRAGLRTLRAKVGLVFQNPDRQLFSASVREDVSFGPCNLGLDKATVEARVAAALESVGMAEHAGKPVHNLSFGQKKRVCIAGVLAMEPELLLLDEPMAGLDQGMQEELLAVLERLHGRGMTILLATHDIEFAYRWADRIHLMAAGRCAASLDAARLPDCADQLAAVGLSMPAVVALHRALAARDLLPAGHRPRTCAELLALLETKPIS